MIRITRLPIRSTRNVTRLLSDKSDKPPPAAAPPSEKKHEEKTETKVEPNDRLNKLLASMSTNSNESILRTVPIPKPKKAANKKKVKLEPLIVEENSENVITVVKNVAAELKGDTKQTESELLSKLLKYTNNENLGLEKDGKHLSLSDLIAGMKVDQQQQPAEPKVKTRSDNVRNAFVKRGDYQQTEQRTDYESPGFMRNRRRPPVDSHSSKMSGSLNLFGEKPLGIFVNLNDLKDTPDVLATWQRLQERELKLSIIHPPANYFQKMILWTEQGKLWQFPIDNEQGLDDEAKNYFTEHIFLDKHIESWCPRKGPIRHFMELVCVGLSKNPYYSVQQKIDHIEWFRQYFDEKKDILEKNIVQQGSPIKSVEIDGKSNA